MQQFLGQLVPFSQQPLVGENYFILSHKLAAYVCLTCAATTGFLYLYLFNHPVSKRGTTEEEFNSAYYLYHVGFGLTMCCFGVGLQFIWAPYWGRTAPTSNKKYQRPPSPSPQSMKELRAPGLNRSNSSPTPYSHYNSLSASGSTFNETPAFESLPLKTMTTMQSIYSQLFSIDWLHGVAVIVTLCQVSGMLWVIWCLVQWSSIDRDNHYNRVVHVGAVVNQVKNTWSTY